MTNDELFARQIHNLNRGLHNLAIAVKRLQLRQPPIAGTAPGAPDPDIAELDLTMQSFHDTLDSLTTQVQKANSRSIILPN